MMLYSDKSYTTAAVAAAGVVGAAYVGYKLYHSKPKYPKEWKQVGVLTDLYVYPIKSCGPIVMETAEVTGLGLRQGWLRDRVLMVIDDKNNFVTARVYPEMLTLHPSVKSSILTLKHTDMEPLVINLAEVIESEIKPETAHVWEVPVPVYDCGWEAREWITKFLDRPGKKFRLVYYASHKSREYRNNANFSKYKFTKKDTGALPDEVPFNLINEASVQDLNTRIKLSQVTHRNFRPNFVLKGAQPYDEDNWNFIKIGENVFEIIKPCGRCVLTTIDPETGIRDSRSEPLETLKSYRQIGKHDRWPTSKSPRMGIQIALRSAPGGLITLNDPIYVA